MAANMTAIPMATESHLAQRRNLPPLPFLKTSFDDTLLRVATPKDHGHSRVGSATSEAPPRIIASPSTLLAPQPTPALKSQKSSSRSSLFNLFHKPNVERAKGHAEQETSPSASRFPRRSKSKSRPKESRHTRSASKSARRRESANLRNQTENTIPGRVPPEAGETTSLGFTESVRETGPGSMEQCPPPLRTAWIPPALSEAYSQSMIHSSLEDIEPKTLAMSRMTRRGGDQITHSKSRASSKAPASRKPSQASIIDHENGKRECHRKIYVLAKSGHVLQYSGEGKSNRVPDKVLQFDSKSAAFVSDAIPGRHWVLRVVQVEGDTYLETNLGPTVKKSFFSRLMSSKTAPRQLHCSELLLVFNCPSEMNAWMLAIRKHIDMSAGSRTHEKTTAAQMPYPDEDIPPVPHRALTMTERSGSSRVPIMPSSPVMNGPSVPTSPTTTDGGRFSEATTAIGASSDAISSVSSKHQIPGRSVADLQRILAAVPVHDQQPMEQSVERPRSNSTQLRSGSQSTSSPHLRSPISNDSEQSASLSHRSGDGDAFRSNTPSTAQTLQQQFLTPASTPIPLFPAPPQAVPQVVSEVNNDGDNIACNPITKPAPRYNLYPAVAGVTDSSFAAPIKRSPTRAKEASKSLTKPPTPPSSDIKETIIQIPTTRNEQVSLERSLAVALDLPSQSPIGNAFAAQAMAPPSPLRHTDTASLLAEDGVPDSEDLTRRASFLSPLHVLPHSERRNQRTSFRRNSPLPLRTSTTSSAEPSPTWPLPRCSVLAHVSDSDGQASVVTDSPTSSTVSKSSPQQYDSRASALQSLVGPSSPPLLDSPTIPYLPLHDIPPPQSTPDPHSHRPLRRPDSLRVKTDLSVAPFLAVSNRSASHPAPALATPRNSTIKATPVSPLSPTAVRKASSGMYGDGKVPVFRPPSVQRPMRLSRQVVGGRIVSLRFGSPPKTAPPLAPLPMPPVAAGVGIGV